MNLLRISTLLITGLIAGCSLLEQPKRVLVFTKTEGYRHKSIPAGVAMFRRLSSEYNFIADTSSNAGVFNEKSLKNYRAVVFLNTTQDILNHDQQAAFERFIQAGGGFVGIHAAADTEYLWPWYGQLVGAYFESHPAGTPTATINVINKNHLSTEHLPERWQRVDEWYNYKNISPDINVLATLDESTYEGGTNGTYHPIAWYHEFDGGRAFYTGGGHTSESYSDEAFVQHVWGGLQWAMGGNGLNYSFAKSELVPEENRFEVEVLDWNLFEPMELEVLPDSRVLFIERHGEVKLYDPEKDTTLIIAEFDVHTKNEDGLLGLALDPEFDQNNWIYLYFSPAGREAKQHLSRFLFTNDQLDRSSEQVILVIPTQREECCHQGGSIEFDSNGYLFLSTGDDTNPFKSQGFAPIDERNGRKPFDAQRTSANANDLRGAILRIKVNADGSYSVPAGNLFAEGTPGTRPEIYIMGNRNPFRISIDPKRGTLYWGEVGPDSGVDSVGFGPKGHDEVNQAKAAGFYGWPYFVGNNKAYWNYDFQQERSGVQFDPVSPVNNSINNTGITALPEAQPAFIWYPYGESEEFPLVGTGGRNAMAGPVFYGDLYDDTEVKFPGYFNGKLFIYDWMRGWVQLVTMDENENFVRMEPFMPNYKFSNPMDMQFAKDGSLYMLEYGTTWYQRNEDARLIRITYNSGNRAPIVAIDADKTVGPIPLSVTFNSAGTIDYDGDELTYLWEFDNTTSTTPNSSYKFATPGVYYPRLTVSDGQGNSVTKEMKIIAGNTPPEIEISIKSNTSFYWDEQPVEYEVKVRDAEDGSLGIGIDQSRVVVTHHYLPQGYDETEITSGHQVPTQFVAGKALIDGSDCKACHKLDTKSIGPSYLQVAEKYQDRADAVSYLSEKILTGGGGVWGEQAMAAHPQLTDQEAERMVNYILSLIEETKDLLPTSGSFVTDLHRDEETQGRYYLKATYKDNGNGEVPSLSSTTTVVLQPSVINDLETELEEETEIDLENMVGSENLESWEDQDDEFIYELEWASNNAIVKFGEYDLKNVTSLKIGGYIVGTACNMELLINDQIVGAGSYKRGLSTEFGGLYKASGEITLQSDYDIADIKIRVSDVDDPSVALFDFLEFRTD